MAKEPRRALLLIDLQNSFFETGSLPVPAASEIIPVVAKLRKKEWSWVFVAKDWCGARLSHVTCRVEITCAQAPVKPLLVLREQPGMCARRAGEGVRV